MACTTIDVARLVQAQYARLPKTGKPQHGEWTILAGVVLTRPGGDAPPEVVALGTGTKCLTAAQVAADVSGECVHDAHAEVCARRALVAFLFAEVRKCCVGGDGAPSIVVEQQNNAAADPSSSSSSSTFALRPGVQLHMYTSEPPCGDAAIFDLPAAAPPATERDAKRPRVDHACEEAAASSSRLHRTGAKPAAVVASSSAAASCGSACAACDDGTTTQPADAPAWEAQQTVGLLRTKPGRGVRTCCMSCSDKLARWGSIGVQGALLSLLLPEPIRFTSVVVGAPCDLFALRRALSRGMLGPRPLADSLADSLADGGGDEQRKGPHLLVASTRFEDGSVARRQQQQMEQMETELLTQQSQVDLRPCSNSLIWAANGIVSEAINGLSGKRLGANKKHPSPKHRSSVCKALRLLCFEELLRDMPHGKRPKGLLPGALGDAERGGGGDGDDGRTSDEAAASTSAGADASTGATATASSGRCSACYAELKQRSTAYQARKAALQGRGGPFEGWVRAPPSCESFTT